MRALVPSWVACDLATGQIIEELPTAAPTGSIGRRIGEPVSASFRLHISGRRASRWAEATEPGRCMIACMVDGTPVWAGIILPRRGGSAPMAELSCATPEAYLDRRYVRDHVWTGQDESSVIAAGLLTDANVAGIGLRIDAQPTGHLRDRTYQDRDDKTVLSALQELSGVEDGPEFTIDPVWGDDARTRIALIARVGRRIGSTGSPTAVFDLPGPVTSYELHESYEQGLGATVVRASGQGSGTDRIVSDDHTASDLEAAGMPRYEYRYTPSTSISDKTTLDRHAKRTLAHLQHGLRTYTFTIRASAAPRLGTDWALGEPLHLAVAASPRHPDGVNAVMRCLGWDWDLAGDTITPTVAE